MDRAVRRWVCPHGAGAIYDEHVSQSGLDPGELSKAEVERLEQAIETG